MVKFKRWKICGIKSEQKDGRKRFFMAKYPLNEGRYGLVLPEKGLVRPVFKASKNVFGSDSDSEDDGKKKPLLRPSHITNRQAKIAQEKAVLDDPTVYQYDEVYDEMVGKKTEEKAKSKAEKKPRYIEALLKHANKRKMENERRLERQIQKDREKEGDEFADKEIFVTSAYKKKLEEMRQEEESEKREEYLEKIGDVTKQQDLGGFYRHLYEQKLGSKESKKPIENDPKNEEKSQMDKSESDVEKSKEKKKNRNYRKHIENIQSHELSEGEIVDTEDEVDIKNIEELESKKAKYSDNIDADSDFSIDSDSGDDNSKKVKESKETLSESKKTVEDKKIKQKDKVKDENNEVKTNKEDKKETVIECKVKIDIWKKRTVGDAFDQALKRYYERKSARGY